MADYIPTDWKDRLVQFPSRYAVVYTGGSGKNLAPGFRAWTAVNPSAITVDSDNQVTMRGTGSSVQFYVDIPVMEGMSYVFSANMVQNGIATVTEAYADMEWRTSAGVAISNTANKSNANGQVTENAVAPVGAEIARLRLVINSVITSGSMVVTSFQFEQGVNPTAYEPPRYAHMIKAPGTITEPGTPVNAANMDHIEAGIDAATAMADAALPRNGSQSMTEQLTVNHSGELASIAGAAANFLLGLKDTGSNVVNLFLRLYRKITGTDWTSVDVEIGRQTDSTIQQKIILAGDKRIYLQSADGAGVYADGGKVWTESNFQIEEVRTVPGVFWTGASTNIPGGGAWSLVRTATLRKTPFTDQSSSFNVFPAGAYDTPRRIQYNGSFGIHWETDQGQGFTQYCEVRLQIGNGAEVVIGSASQVQSGSDMPKDFNTSVVNFDTTEQVYLKFYGRGDYTSGIQQRFDYKFNTAMKQYFRFNT